jgi:hypothetical protein
MDPFSYLSVLTSIVLALGITRVLTGLGKLLQARGHLGICGLFPHLPADVHRHQPAPSDLNPRPPGWPWQRHYSIAS